MNLFFRVGVVVLVLTLFRGPGIRAQETLTLQQALELAMAHNPQVLLSQKEVDAASARILQAEAFPNLEFGISWSETPSIFKLADADERSIGLVQPFEFPGTRGSRRRLAKLEYQFLQASHQRTKMLVSSEVKRGYYNVWLSEKAVTSLETIKELLQQFLETTTVRYQTQKAPFLEVLRVKTEIAKLTNELISARREAQNARAQLNQLLGRAGSTLFTLADDFRYQPFQKDLAQVLTELQPISATRQMIEMLVARGLAQIKRAQKSYLPSFTIGLVNQRVKGQPPFNANQFLGTTSNNNWELEFGISIPLWFWKQPAGEVAEARVVLTQAQIQTEAFTRDATTAIENAYQTVKAAEEQVQLFENSLLLDVEDALQAGIAHYQTDQIDALNLIDLYRTYTTTKAEYYRALYNYQVALTDLEVAGEIVIEP